MRLISVGVVLLLACGSVWSEPQGSHLLEVVDTNPDPRVFAADFSADEQDVLLDDTVVHALVYKDLNQQDLYDGVIDGLPIPQIVVNVGDELHITLRNELSPCAACNTSIHWHGLEVDFDSDGTGVSQNRVAAGEGYTYRFRTNRPGIYWFHPHMKPGPQTFAGMYGVLIVRDPLEIDFQAAGKITPQDRTHTLVLGDIEFDAEGDVGFVFEDEAFNWGFLKGLCANANRNACRAITDGDTVLVNGRAEPATVQAPSGSSLRLRLLNTAGSRYFRLSLQGGADNNLYRIGGEGGFLEQVRLEGGVLGDWDTEYERGEIVLSPAARADVILVPHGEPGEIVTLQGLGFARGGPSNLNPAGELLRIELLSPLEPRAFQIREGDPVLGQGRIEDLRAISETDLLLTPPALPGLGFGNGSDDMTIVFDSRGIGQAAINSVSGRYDTSGDDYTQVPFQGSTRYAKTGDLLELTVSNQTREQHHPFHLHGFSFQLVRVLQDSTGRILHEFDYPEFVDVVDVKPGQSIVIRTRLEDRMRITDTRQELEAPEPGLRFSSGGAAGRWLFHCHVTMHAAVGMISELVVLDTDRDRDGFDTSEDCDDRNPRINPAAPELLGDSVDNDCDGVTDEELFPAPHVGGRGGIRIDRFGRR